MLLHAQRSCLQCRSAITLYVQAEKLDIITPLATHVNKVELPDLSEHISNRGTTYGAYSPEF